MQSDGYIELKNACEVSQEYLFGLMRKLRSGPGLINKLFYDNGKILFLTDINGDVIGLFAFIEKKIFFLKYCLIDFGPIIFNNYGEKEDYFKIKLISEFIKYLENNKISFAYGSHWFRDISNQYKNTFNKLNEKKYATFILDLNQSNQNIFNDFSPANKRAIRKAEKSNISVFHFKKEKAIEYLQEFQILREKTQKRAIKKNKNSSIQKVDSKFLKYLLQYDNCILSIASLNDSVIAGAILLISGNTAYYYIGGSDIELTKETRAANFLHYEIIKYLKENNITYYDFGGSPINPDESHPAYGVYRFKKGFGGKYEHFFGFDYFKNIFVKVLVKSVLGHKYLLRSLKKSYE